MSGKDLTEPSRPPYVEAMGPGRWRLLVWVQPGARKTAPAGTYQDRLKLRIEAPAVDNKANTALTGYVARILGLKRGQVTLAAGNVSRAKTLVIEADQEPSWAGLAPEPNGR